MAEGQRQLKISYLSSVGSAHPLHDYIQTVRGVLLGIGFDEVENNYFVPEEDVYKQYGKEAPVILDRIYYLATLPRPEVGMGSEAIRALREIDPDIDIEALKTMFRQYKEGGVESDDLLETIGTRLGLDTERAIRVLDQFPELRNITPVPTRTTLRSHMTAAWFPTLEAVRNRREYPIKLFSIGPRFRREQRLDATHLRAHYGGSCVILDREIDIDAAKEFTARLFRELGFEEEMKFKKKKIPSNYYSNEYEVFAGKIEVGDFGLYSRRALDNYSIEGEVFNLGFGIERLIMVRDGYNDVRELMYPQFYGAWNLNDEEIGGSINHIHYPESESGKRIAAEIVQKAVENADRTAPCRVPAFEGEISGSELGLGSGRYSVSVELFEEEENARLCGPAYLNQIVVKDGNVYGVPETDKYSDILAGAVRVGTRYIDAFAMGVARKIEEHIKDDHMGRFKIQVKMVKSISDINLRIGGHAKRYILSKDRKIDIRGPMFTAVSVSVEKVSD